MFLWEEVSPYIAPGRVIFSNKRFVSVGWSATKHKTFSAAGWSQTETDTGSQ